MKFPSFQSGRSIGMKLKRLTDQWGELLGGFPALHQKRQAARGGILAVAISDVRQFVSPEDIMTGLGFNSGRISRVAMALEDAMAARVSPRWAQRVKVKAPPLEWPVQKTRFLSMCD
jgi:hypothetical protein